MENAPEYSCVSVRYFSIAPGKLQQRLPLGKESRGMDFQDFYLYFNAIVGILRISQGESGLQKYGELTNR